MHQGIDRVAAWIGEARHAVAFTGAGISTESGIPDFRSPGGVWSRYDPREFTFQRYVAEPEVRKKSWRMRRELWSKPLEPNAGHRALARFEELDLLRGVVTQNIDGLHQRAGSRHVLEIHGTTHRILCLSCQGSWATSEVFERLEAGEEDPSCTDCGGILKTATISFGQQLPADVVEEAHRWAVTSDLFLVVGSSLVVYPAAALPGTAKHAGARLVIVNREPTDQDHLADAVLHGESGPILSELRDRVEASLGT